jgi:hypothetical protein
MKPVLSIRRCVRPGALALAVGGLCLAAATPASAQTKLDAQYKATLAGLPIGEGTWIVDIGEKEYTAAVSGMTTGLLKIISGGKGTGSVHGAVTSGQLAPVNYAATINTHKKTEEVRVSLSGGKIKEYKIEPPQEPNDERVPITEAHRQGVTDPMTGALARMSGTGDTRVAEACQRKVAVFDGRMRYDLQLAFKRMDNVRAKKGYSGPVVVCSIYFTPIAGHMPDRYAIKYLTQARDAEVWLAPVGGTRVMAPYRLQMETPLGMGIVEATQFVSTASTPGSKSAKTQ